LTNLLWESRQFHSFLLWIWSLTKSKPAAKSLLAHLPQLKAIGFEGYLRT